MSRAYSVIGPSDVVVVQNDTRDAIVVDSHFSDQEVREVLDLVQRDDDVIRGLIQGQASGIDRRSTWINNVVQV